MVQQLGQGSQSKVYLVRDPENLGNTMALKMYRSSNIKQQTKFDNCSFETEATIMNQLDSPLFIKVIGYGLKGYFTKPSGETISGIPFILQEHFRGVELHSLAQELHAMGEDFGRHVLQELVTALEHL